MRLLWSFSNNMQTVLVFKFAFGKLSQNYLENMCSFWKLVTFFFLLIKTQLICIKDGGRWTGLMSSDLSHLSEGNGKVWNPKIETHFSVQTQIIRLCKTISEKS